MTPLNTIMLIDDNPADNYYHQLIIEEAEVARHIEVFEYAEQALAHLQQSNAADIDLIFLDINMPRMNGFAFMQAYTRQAKGKESCPVVILLTTSLNPSDEQLAQSFPQVIRYLNKPLTYEVLWDIVTMHFV